MSKQSSYLSFEGLRYFAAGLIGFALLAIGFTLWASRNDAIKAAQRDIGNIASMLSHQMDMSIREIDLILDEFGARAMSSKISTPDQFRDLFGAPDQIQAMRERISRAAHADAITVIDADGRTVSSTRHAMRPGIDLSDSDHVRYLSAHDDSELYVTVPLISRVTGRWMLFFSRRINNGSGALLGIVTVGVELAFFQRAYESIGSLSGEVFNFARRDGTILVHYPDRNGRHAARVPERSPWYDVVAQGGGFFRSPGYFDPEGPRLVAVRPLHDYPLIANVAMLESAVLMTWKQRALLIGIATLLAVSCSVLLLRALTVQFRRLSQSQASLIEREKRLADSARELETTNFRLDAALNNMVHGLCMFDRDQRLVLFNQSYLDIYRLPKDAIRSGFTLFEMFRAGASAATFSGDLVAEGWPRYRRFELPDGRIVAILNSPTPDGGWVSVHQDVTEQHRAETALATARADAERAAQQAQAAHARLLAAIEAIPEGLVIFDAQDRYVLWNRKYSEIYGVPGLDFKVGLRFEDVLRARVACGQITEATGREEEKSGSRNVSRSGCSPHSLASG